MKRPYRLNQDDLNAFIAEVHRFHGQKIYAGLGDAIGENKPYFRLIFFLVRLGSKIRLMNLFALASVILLYGVFRLSNPGHRVFQFDSKMTNRRVFERLNQCLQKDGVEDISMNGTRISFSERLGIVSSFSEMWLAASALTQLRHVAPFAHVQTVIGCASLLIHALHPFPTDLKVICVASDHSPVGMGLMFIARRMALQTCYLQHAPVNRHFPPLDYSLSILFDQASVQAYKQAAADRGLPFSAEIVLLTPFAEVFQRLPPKSLPFVIGICLSFFPDIPALTALIVELLGNANVDHIVLRKHPRSVLDLSAVSALGKVKVGPDRQSGKDFFESVDVVLVPNSGVTIEALHSGRPTFFLPVADKISEKVASDYYGFVEAGILPVFNSGVLASHASLTGFFDSAWLSRFELYDETVATPLEEMRDRVGEKFAELLNG